MDTYAHTKGDDARDWQPLPDHLCAVAELAGSFAQGFSAAEWGWHAGLLHDLGKASLAFQAYLCASVQGKGRRGSVPHAIHGAKSAADRHGPLGKLLAYTVSGHHGGLTDWDDLERRLREAPDPPEGGDADSFPVSFPWIVPRTEPGFALSFFTRMVFSCLVDADWLDTEAFMDRETSGQREGYPGLHELGRRFFPKLEALTAAAWDTPVNRIRREVLEACLTAAELEPGLFSLTVPTGGGKTLSSLAFALRHAQAFDLRRIVYVIPYMSIIEQNAQVFRDFLGDDAVVEHHSSANLGEHNEDEDEVARRARLASENWDAPIIATTAVQFFESLFAAKPSRCRKLHNLAQSVIILDEAQMLPRTLLLPCLAAIRELAERYGTTVVLCTATQPAVKRRDDFPKGLRCVREIVPDAAELHERLRRVRVEHLGVLDDAALSGRLREHDQVLCIVNTRRHARGLYDRLQQDGASDMVHLSATMTAAHRSRVIAAIKAALAEGRPCRVISTQLVEAGVDLDFPVVYRAAAGLDSVAQAAGRCDREGRLTAAAGGPGGQVYVFTPADGVPPGHFRITADTAAQVLRQGYADPLAPKAMEHYFRLLFWQAGDQLDAKCILRELERGAKKGDFPFRTVADQFRLIEDTMQPVIVADSPETQALVRDLEFAPSPRRILRQLQRHMVQVHPRHWAALVDSGAARLVLEGLAVLENLALYDEALGLQPEGRAFMSIEAGII